MAFTEEEIAYIRSQHLGRLGTVDDNGQVDVAPVGYDFDGKYFYVGGVSAEKTRKFRNVVAGHTKVALVFDDLATTDPWAPRFVRIYGIADMVERDGYMGPGLYMRIKPKTSWANNLAGHPYGGSFGYSPPTRTKH
jgi:pyridoxamine 5'-phosphate oxidase family protein